MLFTCFVIGVPIQIAKVNDDQRLGGPVYVSVRSSVGAWRENGGSRSCTR